ncbi:DUF4231 domain-containing protein [Chrysosporum bergii ANA360D]|jgi:hypothetical protein|uniref:DUF4231 domain-containing protein n=1 Tax=Chrysosporum bergii ANA360D TaxID=617107 RepID=A0AA43GRV6_9CYAN|nr:DUF4231 domain-containing protein [Chrysosporum bergii]MDH6060406.1 DUF4231 domain-containing protein [Chrysosporum bergii ANA360D]
MTTPDFTIDELTASSTIVGAGKLSSSPEKKLLTLKIVESLLITILLLGSVVVIVAKENQTLVLYGVISIAISLVLLIINRQVFQDFKKAASEYEANRKAEISTYLLDKRSWQVNNFTPVKAKALQYCQDLINDYKNVRNLSRTIYYILQITTVVFSGITPILVLVDKIEAGQTWLKWLPVICPAIASILASIVTSFPFQKNWVAANTVVELLEAEVEKFILGVTQPYRLFDTADEAEQQQKASQALEYFIRQVNTIHLQQVQEAAEDKQQKGDKKEDKQQESAQSQQSA